MMMEHLALSQLLTFILNRSKRTKIKPTQQQLYIGLICQFSKGSDVIAELRAWAVNFVPFFWNNDPVRDFVFAHTCCCSYTCALICIDRLSPRQTGFLILFLLLHQFHEACDGCQRTSILH